MKENIDSLLFMKNYYNKKLDFELEHKYFVAELESKYKHWFSLRFLYKVFSNYGTSVIRPLIALIIVCLIIFYSRDCINIDKVSLEENSYKKCFRTENIIVRTIVPLNFNCIKEEKVDKKIENKKKVNYWLLGMLFVQTVLNISFLFLIGLALRNRFKLR